MEKDPIDRKICCCNCTHGNKDNHGRRARRQRPLPFGIYPDLQRFCDRTADFIIDEEATAALDSPFSSLDWLLSLSIFDVKFAIPFDGSTFGISSSFGNVVLRYSVEFTLPEDVEIVKFGDERDSETSVISLFSVVGLEVGLLPPGLMVKSA